MYKKHKNYPRRKRRSFKRIGKIRRTKRIVDGGFKVLKPCIRPYERPVCKFYLRNACTRDNCRFVHPTFIVHELNIKPDRKNNFCYCGSVLIRIFNRENDKFSSPFYCVCDKTKKSIKNCI